MEKNSLLLFPKRQSILQNVWCKFFYFLKWHMNTNYMLTFGTWYWCSRRRSWFGRTPSHMRQKSATCILWPRPILPNPCILLSNPWCLLSNSSSCYATGLFPESSHLFCLLSIAYCHVSIVCLQPSFVICQPSYDFISSAAAHIIITRLWQPPSPTPPPPLPRLPSTAIFYGKVYRRNDVSFLVTC